MPRSRGGGRHAGPAATRAERPPVRRLVGLAVGIALALVAWGVLVQRAVAFGSSARGGESAGWALLGLAAVGAAACLLLALILGQRLVATLSVRRRTPAAAARPGGRRARR